MLAIGTMFNIYFLGRFYNLVSTLLSVHMNIEWGQALDNIFFFLQVSYIIFLFVFRPIVPMEGMGDEYIKLKATVIKYERFILKVCCPTCSYINVHYTLLFIIVGLGILCSCPKPSQGMP